MTRAIRRRGHRHERTALGASLLVAIVAHGALVEGADATGLLAGWAGLGAVSPAHVAGAATPPLDPSCDGDALLANAARLTLCASPFVTDVRACFDEVAARLERDRLRCHVEELPSVAFALTPIDATQLEQIDPEPLLELLSEERQQAFEEKQATAQLALVTEAEQRKQQIAREAQVVEIAKPTVEIAPDQAQFVSEYDSKVERETVARGSDREEMVARSRPAALDVKENPREASVSDPTPPDVIGRNSDAPPVPGQLRMRAAGAPDPAVAPQEAHAKGLRGGSDDPLGDGSRARRGDGLLSSEARRASDLPRGEGGAGGGAPPLLRPSDDVLERAVGGGSVDHLEGVDEDEETALNSRQWVFASYFNRMKRVVHQNWDPVAVWRRIDPTGQVYGYKTRVTRVRVTLSPTGELTKIIVATTSGVDLLDDEAVRAFRAAQPFPNPPVGLVDSSGNITFDFGFHLQIGGGRDAKWKIFRAL